MSFTVTETGKKIREGAEAVTDTNYFVPWKSLSDNELEQLENLLEELKSTNLKITQENEEEE